MTEIIISDPSLWGKSKVGKSVDVDSCGERRCVQIPGSIVWTEGGQGPGLIAATTVDLSSITQGLPAAFMTDIVMAYIAFPYAYDVDTQSSVQADMSLRFTLNNGFVFTGDYGTYSQCEIVCPIPATLRVELLSMASVSPPNTPSPFTLMLTNYAMMPNQMYDVFIEAP